MHKKIRLLLVTTQLLLAMAIQANNLTLVPNFTPHAQVDENSCWAAVTQMVLNFKNPKTKITQCEIASKLKGKDCCLNENASACYLDTRLEEAWEAYNLKFIPLELNSKRWPIDPESILKELKASNVVVLRWRRGPGKGNRVSIASGYGSEENERYIYINDSAIGELKLFESNWDFYFPHIQEGDDIETLPVPYAFRAWVVKK